MIDANNLHYERIKHMYMDTYQNKIIVERGYKKMKIICFHNPDEENGYLSNWALSKFTVNGLSFSSMEQYMMYQKAVCFKDEEIAEKNISNNRCCGYKSIRTAGERL